jgi:hypothetical protein
MSLPIVTVTTLRRGTGPILAVGHVAIGELVGLPVRLLDGPDGPWWDVPSLDGRTGPIVTPELAAEILRALVAEVPYHNRPGVPTRRCRACGDLIRYERGSPVDAATKEPHLCQAA